MSLMTIPSREGLAQQIEVDEAVFARLPHGTQILSASRHGSDRWSRSAKLVAKLPDGSIRPYLLRGSAGESGKQMMRGEFESLGAIHSIVPTFVPKPISWGTFRSRPNTYYNLSTYHERLRTPRDATAFCALLARLHTRSRAPDGRFGFHVPTFSGEVPNERVACESWETAFTVGLRSILSLEEEVNGVDEHLAAVREELVARVVPRLLRPLESMGRKIRPALVHGDLCTTNSGEVDTGEGVGVMVFRPAASYAHNEYELGLWRVGGSGLDRRFLRAYLKLVPISEPRGDFEDRNALYSLRHVVACSIRYPGSAKYRRAILVEMGRLVERFSPGPEGGLGCGVEVEEEEVVGCGVVGRSGSLSGKGGFRSRGIHVAGRFVRR